MAQLVGHTVGRSNWSFSAIQTAAMVPRKAAEDFPVTAKCAKCLSSVQKPCTADALELPRPSKHRALRPTSESKGLGSVAKSAGHKS